jgi:hypothetical protein
MDQKMVVLKPKCHGRLKQNQCIPKVTENLDQAKAPGLDDRIYSG